MHQEVWSMLNQYTMSVEFEIWVKNVSLFPDSYSNWKTVYSRQRHICNGLG